MAGSDNKEKGEEVFIDCEHESLLPNERSNLGADAESATKLLLVYHKSGNHMLVKMEEKVVKGLMMALELMGRLREYMGDGRRHDQDPRMKEFRNYAYWITSLSITILVGLLSANKRQPDLLFRSCSSLASGASICGIAMSMLVLIRPSSQRALTCLKTMQYLTIGLLFVAAVLVFTLL